MMYTISMDVLTITAILSSSLLTSFANGFFNRRKNSVEIEDKINEMASRLIDDQRAEIDALNGHILQLRREAKEREEYLENEIDKLKKYIETYRVQANRRREENRVLKEQIEVLKTTFRGLS